MRHEPIMCLSLFAIVETHSFAWMCPTSIAPLSFIASIERTVHLFRYSELRSHGIALIHGRHQWFIHCWKWLCLSQGFDKNLCFYARSMKASPGKVIGTDRAHTSWIRNQRTVAIKGKLSNFVYVIYLGIWDSEEESKKAFPQKRPHFQDMENGLDAPEVKQVSSWKYLHKTSPSPSLELTTSPIHVKMSTLAALRRTLNMAGFLGRPDEANVHKPQQFLRQEVPPCRLLTC